MKTNPIKYLLFLTVVPLLLGACAAPKPKVESPPSELEPDYDVVVIGGGLGGLTTGATLARSGLKVLLLEQHYKVGGCNTSFERGEFQFDASLHQLSMGTGRGAVRDILRDAGALQKIELIQTGELARSVFPEFEFITPNGVEPVIATLKMRWPEEREGIDGYFTLMEQISREMMEISGLYRSPGFVTGINKFFVPWVQPALFHWREATLEEVLDHFFVDEDLKRVLAQYWIYAGPPPSKAWAPGYMLMYYAYVKNGAWQVKGSSQALSDALAAVIEEHGGEVRTGTLVTSIDVVDKRPRGVGPNKVARGVSVADGQSFSARYVVSNADPFQTFFELVGEEKISPRTKKKVESLRPSNSLAGVYLGLDVEPSFFGVEEYELFYHSSDDESAMYEAMMQGRFKEGIVSLTFYSNLNDPFYAPTGKSVLVLNTYSSIDYWPERGEGYAALKAQMVEDLIDMVEKILPGLRDHIVEKEGMTPRTIESFTLHKDGVPYGFDLMPDQWKGMGNETEIDGLFLAGSWANLLHGTGGAILSGHKTARLIVDEEKRRKRRLAERRAARKAAKQADGETR